MKILLSGGGTAGHVNPAVAIADALLKRDGKNEVAIVGRLGGDEYGLVERRGYKLYRIKVEGLSRKNPIKAAKSLFLDISSLGAARKIIKEFSPDVIVGTGGYVSAPVVFSGKLMKIPTLIHESNAYPGLTTKMLRGVCDKILLGFESCRERLGTRGEILTVGNPLIGDFNGIDRAAARRKLGIGKHDFFILSFGGSGGAMMLNASIVELMRAFSLKTSGVRHIHAVGRKYFSEIKESEPSLCRGISGCKILPYIDDMPTMMRAADLVISRSGAITVTEITAVGAPSILIPSPNVSDDHQTKNARHLGDIGASVVISESELTLRRLLDTVTALYESPAERQRMGRAAERAYNPRAAWDIVNQIYLLSKNEKE